MRRSRSLREFRNELIKNRVKSVSCRRKSANQRIVRKKNEFAKNEDSDSITVEPQPAQSNVHTMMHDRRRSAIKKARLRMKHRKNEPRRIINPEKLPASHPSDLGKFENFEAYQPLRTTNVMHIIDSAGMGGAQTMIMKLVNGI